MKKVFLLLLLCNASYGAEYYKCVDEKGRKTFSQNPCSTDAVKMSIDAPDYSGSVAPDSDSINSISQSNSQRKIDRLIPKALDRIDDPRSTMNRKLEAITVRQGRANNNLAGATYRQSLATEKRAVSEQYNTLIGLERDKIARLEQARTGL